MFLSKDSGDAYACFVDETDNTCGICLHMALMTTGLVSQSHLQNPIGTHVPPNDLFILSGKHLVLVETNVENRVPSNRVSLLNSPPKKNKKTQISLQNSQCDFWGWLRSYCLWMLLKSCHALWKRWEVRLGGCDKNFHLKGSLFPRDSIKHRCPPWKLMAWRLMSQWPLDLPNGICSTLQHDQGDQNQPSWESEGYANAGYPKMPSPTLNMALLILIGFRDNNAGGCP